MSKIILHSELHLLWLLALSLVSSCCHAAWFSENHAIMGTAVNVELWHTDPVKAQQAIDVVITEMHRIDNLMSPYKKTSELSKINQQAHIAPVKISDELFQLIKKSLSISRLSRGRFDITFASVGYMYDYRNKIKPSDEQLNSKLNTIDYRNIKLNPQAQTIFFTKPGMRIDLGGIAKGHAVDNCIRILIKKGVKQAMVSAGGDSRILGDKQGRPWLVGIKNPRNKKESSVVLPLSQTAISTSGDYERYFIKNNVRYHHIINPRTGKSAAGIRSVTIIGSDTTTTDALSTTVFILGVKEGMKLVSSLQGIEAIIIDANNKIHYSTGLTQP